MESQKRLKVGRNMIHSGAGKYDALEYDADKILELVPK
jgi:hypothetical protein